MLHDHSGFDRDNPDAAQALEHALPVVAQLMELQRLPQPKNPDDLCALRDQVGEAESELRRIADGASVDATTLRADIERQLRRAAARPAPTTRPTGEAAPASTDTFANLASEDGRLAREIAALERDGARIARDLKARRAAQRKLHRKLYGRGTRLD